MSLFANINMSEVKTGATQKQPIWEPHAPLSSLENDEFSFRTISSDFNVGGVDYKVSCFQMRSGFYERNTNVTGIVKFAQMLQLVEQGLVDTNLAESFGLDCSTFKQDQGKNASRNLCIYVMPLLPNGVRSYLDALTQDIVKKETAKPATVASPAKPATGWAGLNKPATTTAAPTTNAVNPPWGAK